MQLFSSVHLQHLNNTFAAMTKVNEKKECTEQIELLSQSLKAEFETQLQQHVDNLSQTLQSELNKITTTQTDAISSFTQYTKNLELQTEENEFILDSKFKRLEDKITSTQALDYEVNFNHLGACIAEQNQLLQDLQQQIIQLTHTAPTSVDNDSKEFDSFSLKPENTSSELEEKQVLVKTNSANIEASTENCSQYFSKLPWRSDLMTAEVKEKLAKSSEDATKMMQLATESALQAAASVSAPVEFAKDSHLDLETNTDFLNSDTDLANNDDIVSKIETQTLLNVSDKSCQLYFQTLPWNAKSSLTFSATENDENFLESETSFLDAEKVEDETIVDLGVVDSEEFFETLDFNETVTAEIKADANTNAQAYFQTLPWTTRTNSKQIDTESEKIQPLESSIDLDSSFIDELSEEDAFANLEELFLDAEETEMDFDLSFAESEESSENLSFNATENTPINKNTNAQTYFKSLPWAA